MKRTLLGFFVSGQFFRKFAGGVWLGCGVFWARYGEGGARSKKSVETVKSVRSDSERVRRNSESVRQNSDLSSKISGKERITRIYNINNI